MKRILKWLLIIVIIVIVLIAIAATIVAMTVNLNQFKPKISQWVYQHTGRHLVIAGPIEWSLYPDVGLKLSQVTLSNVKSFAQQGNFAQVKTMRVSVQLMPLLSKHVKVNAITLNGLSLNLIQKSRV